MKLWLYDTNEQNGRSEYKFSDLFSLFVDISLLWIVYYIEDVRGEAIIISPSRRDRVERLYETYSDTVFRMAMMYLKSEQEAYDVVQEVFLKLLDRDMKFHDEEHEKAWLLRVAINCCKDEMKSHWWKKRVSLDECDEIRGGLATGDSSSSGAAWEDRQLILAAVRALPDIYKDVVFLYYYEEYSAEEAARILHKNASTVRSRLQKARELLKQSLKEEWL